MFHALIRSISSVPTAFLMAIAIERYAPSPSDPVRLCDTRHRYFRIRLFRHRCGAAFLCSSSSSITIPEPSPITDRHARIKGLTRVRGHRFSWRELWDATAVAIEVIAASAPPEIMTSAFALYAVVAFLCCSLPTHAVTRHIRAFCPYLIAAYAAAYSL